MKSDSQPTDCPLPLRRSLTGALALAAALLSTGCVSQLVEERTFIAENAGRRDLSLVRVEIEGQSTGADMKFRAGYRPTAAVDEVLKGETTPITVQGGAASMGELNKSSTEITRKLLRRLEKAYEARETPQKIAEIENDIVRARSMPRVVNARETSQISEAPAEKFVIAFSADPSKVFKAIADTTARSESEGAIFKSLLNIEEEARGRATEERDQRTAATAATQATLKATWEALLGDFKGRLPAEVKESDAPDAVRANHEKLREELRSYQLLLENFLATQP